MSNVDKCFSMATELALAISSLDDPDRVPVETGDEFKMLWGLCNLLRNDDESQYIYKVPGLRKWWKENAKKK